MDDKKQTMISANNKMKLTIKPHFAKIAKSIYFMFSKIIIEKKSPKMASDHEVNIHIVVVQKFKSLGSERFLTLFC